MRTTDGSSFARRALAGVTTLLALGACATAPSAGPPVASATTMRVMTYNIFAGNDLERRSNLARVAALIDSLDVDVVFLQEVDRGTARSGGVDQAAVIAGTVGLRGVYGRAMDFDGGEYGIAILTRWPVHTWRVVPLDSAPPAGEAPAHEPRILLHAVVSAPGGDVHLLNTHLHHGADPAARHAQVLRVLAYVAEEVPRPAPIAFGGDLNATPDAAEVRALALFFRDTWRTCGSGDGFTFRSDRPTRRIDYVLLAGMDCTRAWVPDLETSDHRPVIVDVRTLDGTVPRAATGACAGPRGAHGEASALDPADTLLVGDGRGR
jgi:endonuclease/exonuclease/phosphatase family metal-dependent hydrolase